MGLQKEIWIKDIQENLYSDNEFLTRSMDHSAYVSNKTVHVPNAGSAATVVANRSSYPASAAQRTDNDLNYSLVEYSLDPTLITNIEELQVNYDKRKSILFNQIAELGESVANRAIYSWAPSGTASRVITTTGTAVNTALAPSATGTRNAITLADIASARALLDRDKVPQKGRVLIIPSDMYNAQLLNINNIVQAQNFGNPVLPSGVITTILGFDVYIRPSVAVYATGSVTLKAIGANGIPSSPAATDMLGALAFHPNFVCSAKGEIKVFYNADKAEYYGDLFSALVMYGASPLRSDLKGIVAIVQA